MHPSSQTRASTASRRCRANRRAAGLARSKSSNSCYSGNQAEIDRYWNALLEGGSAEQCGWLNDRFGVSWQIVPTVLFELMADPDRGKAKRATDAMMKMVKLDIAVLRAAFAGTSR